MKKSYWDLTEKERSELSHEGVEAFVSFELMSNGVLAPRAPELVDEPKADPQYTTVFVPTYQGRYGKQRSDVGFLNRDACEAALKGVLVVDLASGTEVWVGRDAIDIEAVQVVPHVQHETLRETLEQIRSIREANEAERKRYASEVDARNKVLDGMWDDWTACREKAAKMRRIASTMEEYNGLLDGDVARASTFLRKAFAEAEIEKAVAWCGFEYIGTPIVEMAADLRELLPADDCC